MKGIGPKKALKALILPTGEIAQAIETRNSRFLVELPQIGKRMAEQVIAELAGTPKFATTLAGSKGRSLARASLPARPARKTRSPR